MLPNDDLSRFVEIYRGDLWNAELLKAKLNDAGIECFLQEDGFAPVTSPYINQQGCALMVHVNDEEQARLIIK